MLRRHRPKAPTLLTVVLLVVTLAAPQPSADAVEGCAEGWTDAGDGICELVVTADGAVVLPSGRVFDVLVVGGGGGGAGAGGDAGDAANTRGRAGGGGGGAVVVCTAQTLAGPLTVTIGAGGGGSPGDPAAVDGGDGDATLVLDGTDEVCSAAGGKGGRAAGSNRPFGEDPWGDGGASGNGRSGGQSQWTNCIDPCDWYTSAGGGGGGAGAVGANASSGVGGAGGAGAGGAGLFTDDMRRFGGGGGGGSGSSAAAAPPGGTGGGGAGSRPLSSSTFDAAVAGTANTGGGGGGGSAGSNFRSGGAGGGTGVVILRYDVMVLGDDPSDGDDGSDDGDGGIGDTDADDESDDGNEGEGDDGIEDEGEDDDGSGDGIDGDGNDGDGIDDGRSDGGVGEEGALPMSTDAATTLVPTKVNTGGGPVPVVPLPLALGLLAASIGVLLVQRDRELVWAEAWAARQRRLRDLPALRLPAFDLLQSRLDHLRHSLAAFSSPAAVPAATQADARRPSSERSVDGFDSLALRLETFRREHLT
jgi:hypothetical protein